MSSCAVYCNVKWLYCLRASRKQETSPKFEGKFEGKQNGDSFNFPWDVIHYLVMNG